MALWLRKGGGFVYVEAIAAKSYTKCHSFAQKETSEFDRHGSEPVRVSTLKETQCCKFMPLTFPSKQLSRRPKGRKFSHSAPPNPSRDLDGDTADWISQVVNDPLVEVDPVTMSQHLLAARRNGEPSPAQPRPPRHAQHRMHHRGSARVNSALVSTCQQPFTYFSPPPQGFGRILVAVGAAVVLAGLASAIHLFRARRQLEKVVNYDSSSDEENKLDLLSLVESQQQDPEELEEQEVRKQMERVLLKQQKTTAEEEVVLESVSPEVVYAAAVAAIAMSDEFQQAFAQQRRAIKVPVDMEHGVPSLVFQMPPRSKALTEQQEVQGQAEQRYSLAGDDQEFRSGPYSEKQAPGSDNDDLKALADLNEDPLDLLVPDETSKEVNKQKEFLRQLELLSLAVFVFVFLGVPGTQSQATDENGLNTGLEKENEIRKAVQAAVPAVAVGAGAVSIITGVDGALEMVGLAATASFIYFDLLWADSRKDLCQEFRKINDHRKLIAFLKSKKIVQPDS